MAFEVGDKVRHAQCPSLRGIVIGIGREETFIRPGTPSPHARKIYWKGHDPFNPEKVDWTWDFAMEHDNESQR